MNFALRYNIQNSLDGEWPSIILSFSNDQSFLTGAASKNLEIEGIIATSSEYGHEPVTVEKLDASNLNVLLRVENSVNQRQPLEDISPSLKFFL